MPAHDARAQQNALHQLLAAETTLLSAKRQLGLLKLQTDRGAIELVINRTVAERLMSAVVEFLQACRGHDAPKFAVERSQ